MIEQVLKGKNLYEAYRQVVRNKGASGVDQMKVGELKAFFIANHQKVITSIVNQKYVPQPILGRTEC